MEGFPKVSKVNTQARRFGPVKIYAGDAWYPPVQGLIRKVKIDTKYVSTTPAPANIPANIPTQKPHKYVSTTNVPTWKPHKGELYLPSYLAQMNQTDQKYFNTFKAPKMELSLI